MARSYWLMKSEPFKYAWSELVSDGWTYWDGVRNYEARNNLAAMKVGDLSLYYHSNVGKEVVGVARVIKQAYQDPTTDDDRWVVVDVAPVVPFERSVTLAEIKGDARLANINLIRRGRLSVVGIEPDEFEYILKLGKTKLPRVASKGAEKKRAKKSAKKGARKPAKKSAKKPPKKKAAAKK
jgi:predicted RNA-binding protein with PUA-like domain